MSWEWLKQRCVATLKSKSFKCLSTSTGKRLPWNWTLPLVEISFLLASGQSWASRNFNRLSSVTIRQVSIPCRSLELSLPRPSTVMSASHTQFRFLCPKFLIWICLVGMLLTPCGFPWMTSCFPKLRLTRRITGCWLFLDLTAWIDTYNRHFAICVPSSANFSSPSWGVSVVLNLKFNLNQTQGPSSTNHAPFHLPCRKN